MKREAWPFIFGTLLAISMFLQTISAAGRSIIRWALYCISGRMRRIMKKVLRGPDGCLRLLWRLLSYFVLHLVVAMGAQVVLPLFDPSSPGIVVSRLLFATIYISGMLALTYFYRRKVDQKPWSGMGLPALRRNWHFLVGGFLLCVLIFLQFFCVDLAAGFVRIDGDEITASGVWLSVIYALASLIFCVGIG